MKVEIKIEQFSTEELGKERRNLIKELAKIDREIERLTGKLWRRSQECSDRIEEINELLASSELQQNIEKSRVSKMPSGEFDADCVECGEHFISKRPYFVCLKCNGSRYPIRILEN